MAFNRVPVTSLPLPNYADGQILFGADVNIVIDVFKTAINANGQDIATILSGDREANVATTFAALSLIEDPDEGDQALVLNDENEDGQTSLYSFDGDDWVIVYQISILQMKQQLDGIIDGDTTAAKAAELNDGTNVVTAARAKQLSDWLNQAVSTGSSPHFADVTANNFITRSGTGLTQAINYTNAVTLSITQDHIDAKNNPHEVSKGQVGLGSVTDHAQVKKLASSTSGNVPTWDGITGDALTDGFGVQTTTLTTSTTQLARADVIKAYVDGEITTIDGKIDDVIDGTTDIDFAPGLSGLTSETVKDAILEIYAEKGQENGIATLNGQGKVPANQLPSFVDDLEEYANLAAFPSPTGESDKIYVAIDTGKIYRWSGSQYVEIAANEVNSVNNKTGIVVLDKTDIGLSNVTNDAQVTAVTGTAPIVSTGGTTPAISIDAATSEAAGSMSATDKAKLDNLTAETLLFDEATFTGQLLTDPATTNVQDALILLDTHDHVVADITDLDASTVTYDNTGQNLVATDVQAAINEIDDLVEEGLTVIQVVTYVVTDADDGSGGFTYAVNGGSPVTGGTITNGVYQFPLPAGTEYTTGTNRLSVKIDASNGSLKRLFFGADQELTEPSDTSFGIDFALSDNDVLYAKLYQSLATVAIEVGDGSITQSKIADGAVNNNKLANNTVEFTKIQQIPTNRILGNDAVGTGNIKSLTAAETKTLLALDQVDNTSDMNKPISSNTQTALDGKADKTNVLELDNTGSFTPSADFHPSTKKYVDDTVGALELGVDNLSGIGDVTITNVQDGEALVYDSVSGDWINSQVSGVQNIDAGSSTTVFSVADINIDGGNSSGS